VDGYKKVAHPYVVLSSVTCIIPSTQHLTNGKPRKRLAGHVPPTGEKRDARKPEGNRVLGRPRLRREGTIIMYTKKQGTWCGMDSSGSE